MQLAQSKLRRNDVTKNVVNLTYLGMLRVRRTCSASRDSKTVPNKQQHRNYFLTIGLSWSTTEIVTFGVPRSQHFARQTWTIWFPNLQASSFALFSHGIFSKVEVWAHFWEVTLDHFLDLTLTIKKRTLCIHTAHVRHWFPTFAVKVFKNSQTGNSTISAGKTEQHNTNSSQQQTLFKSSTHSWGYFRLPNKYSFHYISTFSLKNIHWRNDRFTLLSFQIVTSTKHSSQHIWCLQISLVPTATQYNWSDSKSAIFLQHVHAQTEQANIKTTAIQRDVTTYKFFFQNVSWRIPKHYRC